MTTANATVAGNIASAADRICLHTSLAYIDSAHATQLTMPTYEGHPISHATSHGLLRRTGGSQDGVKPGVFEPLQSFAFTEVACIQ